MSHRKDTDYLAISARVRAMENRLLTRERMDRIIDARDEGEARKVLAECGYPEAPGASLESVLTQVREQTRKELLSAIPDGRLLEIFTLKYDYHNAKTIIKAGAVGADPSPLLLGGGRYEPAALLEGGNVLPQTILSARGGEITEPFRSGALAKAAELGAAVAKPDSGALTVFERACDDAVTAYLAAARRVPFGEEVVIGYLYAKEAELTAVRTMFAGRAARLDGEIIRQRLRNTYC